MATAVFPEPREDVAVGVVLPMVEPPPSLPEPPSPQHLTVPSSKITQVCESPAAMSTAYLPEPKLDVGVGVSISPVSTLPVPSLPLFWRPQQFTLPLSSKAHVCNRPVVILETLLLKPYHRDWCSPVGPAVVTKLAVCILTKTEGRACSINKTSVLTVKWGFNLSNRAPCEVDAQVHGRV